MCLFGAGWDPETPVASGQGWGGDGWQPVYLVPSTEPGCLVSPPPELICSKEDKEFHHILTIARLYLQLTFFECFLYACNMLCVFYMFSLVWKLVFSQSTTITV